MALTEKDYFPPRGYVVVVQDTRGRHSSEGDFHPFVHEARDGYDAVEWAAALPCSDGRVSRSGGCCDESRGPPIPCRSPFRLR